MIILQHQPGYLESHNHKPQPRSSPMGSMDLYFSSRKIERKWRSLKARRRINIGKCRESRPKSGSWRRRSPKIKSPLHSFAPANNRGFYHANLLLRIDFKKNVS